MPKKRLASRTVKPAFYTVPKVATMLGLSYEATLGLVQRNELPAMQLRGSRMYIIPAYWIADLLLQCVEFYGPPTTAAGLDELARAGVSETAVMQATEAYLIKQGQEGTADNPLGDPQSPPVAATMSAAPMLTPEPGLKNGS